MYFKFLDSSFCQNQVIKLFQQNCSIDQCLPLQHFDIVKQILIPADSIRKMKYNSKIITKNEFFTKSIFLNHTNLISIRSLKNKKSNISCLNPTCKYELTYL